MSTITYSFRTDEEVARRVDAQAEAVTRLPGEPVPSRHKMAKALMVEALEAREKKARKQEKKAKGKS